MRFELAGQNATLLGNRWDPFLAIVLVREFEQPVRERLLGPWVTRLILPVITGLATKNGTPVYPKQFLHIHCSVCVHVCGYTSSDARNV